MLVTSQDRTFTFRKHDFIAPRFKLGWGITQVRALNAPLTACGLGPVDLLPVPSALSGVSAPLHRMPAHSSISR